MLLQRKLVGSSKAADEQFQTVKAVREVAEKIERRIEKPVGIYSLKPNSSLIPEGLYQEFDNVTIERMRADDGDTFLNDLLPLSKSVSIGKLVHAFRRVSDAGIAETSMSGQMGVKMDQVEYNYDKSIIPMHQAGFSRDWREMESYSGSGFDALIDDQRATVETVREHIADQFISGHRDKQNNLIKVDGVGWGGMSGDDRVAQVDVGSSGLNFDFTDTTKTYSEIEAKFKQIRDVLYIDNNCTKDATYYVSRQIMSNFERSSSESYDSQQIMKRLASLMGVAAIKVTSKLVGNKMMAFPLDSRYIQPLVGMGLNTVARPRQMYDSPHQFVTSAAVGFQIKTDYDENKGCLFVSALS